jgi:hypothetical protein
LKFQCQAAEVIKVGGAKQFMMEPKVFEDRISGKEQFTSLWNVALPAEQGFFLFDECKRELPELIGTSEKIRSEINNLNTDMDALKVSPE